MKGNLRFLVVMGVTVAMSIASVCAQEQNETLGDKLKKLFHRPTPTPTPTPRRSHPRDSPLPNPSPNETPASLSEGSPPIPTYGETPEPSASAETSAPVEAKTPQTQYFEPVRPINPGPEGRTAHSTIYSPAQMIPLPSETPSPIPEVSEEVNPEERPMPSLPAVTGAGSSSTATNQTAVIAIASEADIAESKDYPEDVRKLVDTGLDLAKKNLDYKYASADPANGGLDCSGFIYYVLTKSGVRTRPVTRASNTFGCARPATFKPFSLTVMTVSNWMG